MKIRNKKTGEIGELHYEPDKEYHFTVATEDPADMMIFKTLAGLNEKWEDYEEPKPQVVYYIDRDGEIVPYKNAEYLKRVFDTEQNKEIGNYFETREEAEKAVDKLKAWKRLKDKGFVWQGWEEGAMDNGMCVIGCQIPENNWETDVVEDLDLLFGGEE